MISFDSPIVPRLVNGLPLNLAVSFRHFLQHSLCTFLIFWQSWIFRFNFCFLWTGQESAIFVKRSFLSSFLENLDTKIWVLDIELSGCWTITAYRPSQKIELRNIFTFVNTSFYMVKTTYIHANASNSNPIPKEKPDNCW